MPQMKLAIIGGGPSAFYVASRLLSLIPQTNARASQLRIHMFDRLWSPHGLVRYGVAPDHPEVKNCTNKFDQTASDTRFSFFGNVNVGKTSPVAHSLNVPLSSILSNYTHLLFATGCTLPTLHPSLPQSPHCMPSLSLVHWYTQHPSRSPIPPLESTKHVTLIGNGNVSLDIARLLLSPPRLLSKYDIPDAVFSVLTRSAVKHVSILGRRGPLEAAFTTKELRELLNLSETSMLPLDPTLLEAPAGVKPTRQQSRINQLLKEGSKTKIGDAKRTWSLDFYRSPTSLTPPTATSLAALELAHTRVNPETRSAELTGASSTLRTSLVVTSLGFHAEPENPLFDPKLGHLGSAAGRALTSAGSVLQNVYTSGWAAMGAKGVLAATMRNAYAVADTILADMLPGDSNTQTTASAVPPLIESEDLGGMVLNPSPNPVHPPLEVQEGLRAGLVTTYKDWLVIDEEEKRRGSINGKERERMGWNECVTYLSSLKASTTKLA